MQELIHNWIDVSWLGNPIYLWVLTPILFAVLYFGLRGTAHLLALRFARGPAVVRPMSEKVSRIFLLTLALFLASIPLDLSPTVDLTFSRALMIGSLLQAGAWGNIWLRFWIEHTFLKRGDGDESIKNTVGLISTLAQAGLYSTLVMLGLNNLGVNISALVAGLGVGGIAVALAAQNILGDLFSSLTIVLDKPFIVGDSILVDNISGTVEHIGLKTTRVRALTGEQLIYPNSALLQSRIHNFKRMQERRVTLALGVTYQTSPEQVKKIPGILREIIARQPEVRFDRAHFKTFGSSSLDFETVYWILTSDYGRFMDHQQEINWQIFNTFNQMKIDFAYPTQTVFAAKS